MKIIFKILFSPILILWWLLKLSLHILFIPVIIFWKILELIAPELTRPLKSITSALGSLFRLW